MKEEKRKPKILIIFLAVLGLLEVGIDVFDLYHLKEIKSYEELQEKYPMISQDIEAYVDYLGDIEYERYTVQDGELESAMMTKQVDDSTMDIRITLLYFENGQWLKETVVSQLYNNDPQIEKYLQRLAVLTNVPVKEMMDVCQEIRAQMDQEAHSIEKEIDGVNFKVRRLANSIEYHIHQDFAM